MRKNVIITGQPRSGKSTLLKKLVSGVEPKTGFVTSEIREGGQRVGFGIETHWGSRVTFAHVSFQTSHRVSRYAVDVGALELVISQVSAFQAGHLLYLDEIGQMQLFSKSFRRLVLKFFGSRNTCLATLSSVYRDDFTANLRGRDDIILVQITPDNREDQAKFVAELLRKVEKARRYISEPGRFTVSGSLLELKSEHGVRHLSRNSVDGGWSCDCNFYGLHQVCSHVIAAEEFAK